MAKQENVQHSGSIMKLPTSKDTIIAHFLIINPDITQSVKGIHFPLQLFWRLLPYCHQCKGPLTQQPMSFFN